MSFPLHEAALEHKALIVKGLLKENPKQVFTKDLDGRVALHWAVSANDTEIVSMLLNPWIVADSKPFEIDLDDFEDQSGWTPLHIAASIGNLDIIKMLVDAGASVKLQTGTGQTVLHLSVLKNLYESTHYFLDQGASARVADKKGQTPLFRAASNGYTRLVKLLCEQGKSALNTKDIFGWTPMHHALAEGHADTALELVRLGADPEVEDRDGKKPKDVAVDEKTASFFTKQLESS